MATATLNGVDTYYEVQGQGEPVLLVPASWWPSDTWNVGAVPFLSQRFKTIVFDCRGTGRSGKPKDGYTVEQFSQDCIALLAHLGVSRCHAVGFALGGQVVQAMAIERPDLVATLTIAASGAGAKTLAGGPRSLSPDTEREIRDIGFERYIRNYIENDTMAFNPKFYREHPEVVAALADAVWSGQSTVEMFRRHEDARLTWDTLGESRRGESAGADSLRRRRRREPARQHARRNGKASRRDDAWLRIIFDSEHETYDFLGRRRRVGCTAGVSGSPPDWSNAVIFSPRTLQEISAQCLPGVSSVVAFLSLPGERRRRANQKSSRGGSRLYHSGGLVSRRQDERLLRWGRFGRRTDRDACTHGEFGAHRRQRRVFRSSAGRAYDRAARRAVKIDFLPVRQTAAFALRASRSFPTSRRCGERRSPFRVSAPSTIFCCAKRSAGAVSIPHGMSRFSRWVQRTPDLALLSAAPSMRRC